VIATLADIVDSTFECHFLQPKQGPLLAVEKTADVSTKHVGPCVLGFTSLLCALKHPGPNLLSVLRQSYDTAEVTILLRQTSNLQNILRRTRLF